MDSQKKRRTYAVLSKIAYDSSGRESVSSKLRHYGLSGFVTYLPKMSTDSYKTFLDRRSGKVVISYRGTRPTNINDLVTDTAIFFGVERLTPRFQDALNHAKIVEKTVGKGKVEVTGHSLGGSEALYVTKNTGIPSVTFNPGKTFEQFDILNNYDKVKKFIYPKSDRTSLENARIYKTRLDPVSLNSSRFNADVVYVNSCQYDMHAIDNFI